MALTQDEFFDDEYRQKFPQVGDDVQALLDEIAPQGGLTEQEMQELNRLSAREGRLSPMEMPRAIGSTRIGGNPFSFDVSPAVNAAQNAIVKGINAVRQRRMMKGEDEANELMKEASEAEEAGNVGLAAHLRQQAEQAKSPNQRLERLRTKQERGEESRETRRNIMEELVPSLAGKMADLEGRLREEDVEHGNTMTEIKERTTQAIREFKNTKSPDESGGQNPKHSVRLVGDFINKADPYKKSITSIIENLEKQKALVDNPEELEKRIENLKAERAELEQWETDAYRALNEGNVYDENLIERWEAIMQSGSAPEPDGEGGFNFEDSDFNFIENMLKRSREGGFDYQPQPNPGTGAGGASGDITKVKSRVNFDTDDEKKK